MTDQEYADLKALIEAYCDKWKTRLNLENWYIEYFWHRNGLPGDKEGELNLGTMARTECNWQYMFSQIHFNMPRLIHAEADRVENAVVHELMHCHIDELAWLIDDEKNPTASGHIERVTTILANLFIWNDTSVPQSVKEPAVVGA